MVTKNKTKILSIIVILAVLFLLLPFHATNACVLGINPISQCVSEGVSLMFQQTFLAINGLTALLSNALSLAVNIRAGGSIPVVADSWKILRDFANMVFIIALIWMAFATIFDRGSYTFKNMIVRFLIVAVLINFSLVLGNLVIDFCQILTNVFLSSIGNLGNRLGSLLNPALLFNASKVTNGIDFSTASLTSLIFAIVLALIFFFSLLVATVYSVVRIPIIWGLLIISPVYWMAYIFPGTQKRFNWWWSMFWGWNMFLPVYLFFMYLGLTFLGQRDEIIKAVIQSNSAGANPGNGPLLQDLSNSLTFNILFFYLFTAFVMVGGTWAAKSVTSAMGGTGFEKGLGWARKTVGGITGYDARKEAISGAYAAKTQEFKQQGFKNPWLNRIYGGKEAQDRLNADYKNSPLFRTQRQFTENSKAAYTRAENDYNTGKLNIVELKTKAEETSAKTPTGYAYRKLLIEKGGMTGDLFKQTLQQLKGNPYAINDLVKTAKEKKFAGITKVKDLVFDPLFTDSSYFAAKREMLMYIATDAKMAGGLKKEDVEKAVALLGGKDSSEAKKFLDDLAKIRPDLVFDFKKDVAAGGIVNREEKDADGNFKVTNAKDYWEKAVRTEAKNLVDMPKDVWNNKDFQEALRSRFSEAKDKKQKGNLKNSLDKLLQEKGEKRTGGKKDKDNKKEKLDILDELAGVVQYEPEDEQDQQEEQNQPPATTVNYNNRLGVKNANVIDLRNNKDIELR